jgi:DEAD/DEAH box helicase domain-containing protein
MTDLIHRDDSFNKPWRKPWSAPAGIPAVLEHWRKDNRVYRNMVLDTRQEPTPGLYRPIPEDLPEGLRVALKARGIEEIFSHQDQAWNLAKERKHFVIATPTASGKSLCYNLPVMAAIAEAPETRALYLFPTKALARDQEEGLRALMREAGLSQGVITYDGDTPADARRAGREKSGVLLTNPDMLHAGILPHHANWARLFSNLRYVVIDELHTYRGIFGSHLANLVRRLRRIARFHGADPIFLFASATIGNPAEHASRMVGEPVELIGESGAPTGQRHVLAYNPPVVNAELGIRQSCIKVAVRFAAELIEAKVSTIIFGQSRNNVEVMLKYLRERLVRNKMDPELVQGYRGGYLPQQRRMIEAGLRDGEVGCVVATNALELGIDIGSLDAVICAGYPGSIASLWQRFGRAGRRQGDSLAVLVTNSSPLNQFFATHPDGLVTAPVEQARIDPDNVEILIQHLKCAAFELPFESTEPFGDLPPDAVADGLDFLADHEVLHAVSDDSGKVTYHWATDTYPASHVSLRSVGWDNYVVIDLDTDKTIAEMDWRSTHTMLHEQAIYQHNANQYQVEKLDYDNHKAFVRKVTSDYYTDAMTHVRIAVIEESESLTLVEAADTKVQVSLGEISVVEKVVGYKKIKYHTHENVGYGEVRLPEMEMHTTAFWLTIPSELVEKIPASRPSVIDALRGISKAMHTVATIGLMTDPRDIGRRLKDQSESQDESPGQIIDPTIYLYDKVPGGIGLAPRLFDEREGLISRARLVIDACPCEGGCPACIGPVIGSEDQGPGEAVPVEIDLEVNRKALAVAILKLLDAG